MKNLRILTIHFGTNHGSVLQAFALSNFLKSNELDVKIIDYIPKRYKIWNDLYRRKKDVYPLPLIIAYYPVLCMKTFSLRHKFRKFCKNNLCLTEQVNDYNGLVSIAEKGDVFIAGSDQIWNEDYNGLDEFSYYFDFVPESKKRIAYAASFGKEDHFETEYSKVVLKYLSKFEKIGMREKAGVDKLNYYGINGVHVCDPTMLLTVQQWREFSKDSKYNKRTKPYILVYVMDGVYDKLLDCAQIVKEEFGFEIYVVAFNKIQDTRIDSLIINADPKDFVSLIDGSSCVITNSFHGTVFSVIFDKPQVILGKNMYNSRMLSLLEKCGKLEHFIPIDEVIDNRKIIKIVEKEVVDSGTREKINNWITDSKVFLESAI